MRDVWIPILTVLGLGHEEGTGDKRRGIRCNFTTALEDSDFADDVALLSSTFNDLHKKTGRLAEDAARVGLRPNGRKTVRLEVAKTLYTVCRRHVAHSKD